MDLISPVTKPSLARQASDTLKVYSLRDDLSRQVTDLSMATPEENPEPNQPVEERRSWLRALTLSSSEMLEEVWRDLADPPHCDYLRRPETGLAMVRGRAGGSGAAFNLCEMTITRCTVTIADSETGARIDGVACVAGRDQRHADLVAKLDAVFQEATA